MTEMLPLTVSPLPVRLRAADYLLLDRAGAFKAYGKTELLDGEIVYVNAQHRPHGQVKMALYRALTAALEDSGSPYSVAVEVSVALNEHDAPEPDLTVTCEPDGAGLIPVASIALIVEVADATLQSDLGRKARIYARAGIAEYWVADVDGRVIHQMWSPVADDYTERLAISFGHAVQTRALGGIVIDTTRL